MSDEFEYTIQINLGTEFIPRWEAQCTYDSIEDVEHDYYIQYEQRQREGRSTNKIRIAKRLKADWEEV